MRELVPTKATFSPGEPVEIEVRGGGPASVSLWRLDDRVAEVEVGPGDTLARFPAQAVGAYGVECADCCTALDVLADPLERARYGFVSDYSPGRDVAAVVDNVRRLHLNAVQFYDWMYRHARLLPPADDFVDSLGRPLSLDTVRRLATAIVGVGGLPLGYAAVYAAGVDEWPSWQDEGLYRGDGTPWTLGLDFLWNVDPSSERWLEHFARELRAALAAVDFAGFHLDQYGAPKVARRLDGRHVDLADAFPALIERLAVELPSARLIFNNVNDFPTESTATAPQDAVYIEVWSPHDRLEDLSRLAAKARLLAPTKSVILAAYLAPFAGDDEAAALQAQRFALAAAATQGASLLLHGEEHSVLTEAYYVRHGELSADAHEATRRVADFIVRYGDLFFDRAATDVTTTHSGGVNEEMKVLAPVPVSHESRAGSLWARVIRTSGGLLVSLVDLSAQDDDSWNAPKHPASLLADVHLSVERRFGTRTRFLFASPDTQPALQALEVDDDGRYDTAALPAFSSWAIVYLPDGDDA